MPTVRRESQMHRSHKTSAFDKYDDNYDPEPRRSSPRLHQGLSTAARMGFLGVLDDEGHAYLSVKPRGAEGPASLSVKPRREEDSEDVISLKSTRDTQFEAAQGMYLEKHTDGPLVAINQTIEHLKKFKHTKFVAHETNWKEYLQTLATDIGLHEIPRIINYINKSLEIPPVVPHNGVKVPRPLKQPAWWVDGVEKEHPLKILRFYFHAKRALLQHYYLSLTMEGKTPNHEERMFITYSDNAYEAIKEISKLRKKSHKKTAPKKKRHSKKRGKRTARPREEDV